MEIPGRRSFLKVMAGSPALLTYGCVGLGAAKAVGRKVSRDRQAELDKFFDMERFLKQTFDLILKNIWRWWD